MKGGTGITIAGDGITINHSNVVNSGTVTGGVGTSTTNGGKFTMPKFSFDNEGHLTSWDTVEVTLPLITASRDLEVSGNNIQHTTTITAVTEHLGGSSDATLEFGNTFQIPYFKYSAYGHFTASGLRTITLPSYTVTESKNGLMSKEDKAKLNALSANAWYKFKVNTVNIEPDAPQDTIEFVAGSGMSLTGDATNDKITFNHSNNVTAGSNVGGTSNLTPGFGGTATLVHFSYDTQGHITGSGTHTVTIPNTVASTANNGLMTATQVTKLNGIAEGATADSALTQSDILTRVNNALGTSYTTSTATWPSS